MEWVAIVVVLILLIGGFVGFLVINASKKSSQVAAGPDEGPPGIGTDETPLGDTTEHAGETTRHGTTVGGQDAEESGGTGRPVHSGMAETSDPGGRVADPDAAAHVGRPGEGEGREQFDFEGTRPPGAERGSAADDAPAARAAESPAGDDAGQAAESGSEPAESPAQGSREATEGDDTRPESERLADRGF